MATRLLIFIGLFLLCSYSGLALKMNEKIEVEGYGQISALTDQNSVYDSLNSYGDIKHIQEALPPEIMSRLH